MKIKCTCGKTDVFLQNTANTLPAPPLHTKFMKAFAFMNSNQSFK